MQRFLLVLSVVLVGLALLAGAVGALAYGTDAKRDGELAIDGVRQPVSLSWDTDGSARIEAASVPDLALGLGYAHAADHAWSMALWRQAGRGGLGAWLGPEVRALDRHARSLGFEAVARRTYRGLDDDTRTALDAYAAGVNAALRQPGVAQGDQFVRMDIEPDDWQPWDALTVERVMAYLATPPPATDSVWTQSARRDSSLAPFLTADSTFRATLGIGGTDGARAFVAPSAEGQAFVAHQPAGASTLPLFAPVTFQLNGRTVAATTIPGTVSAPTGWTGTDGWALFLTSSMRLDSLFGETPPVVHSRIVERDGDEVLVEIPRDTSGLVLAVHDAPAGPDSLRSSWRMRWSGFRPGTDASAFLAFIAGTTPPPFALLRGDGLRVRGGQTAVLGAPPVARSAEGIVLVGATAEAGEALTVLTDVHGRTDSLSTPHPASVLASSDISSQAARTLQPLLAALGDRDSLDRVLQVPYSFLKGWNHRYAPDAIAPSIFETWLESHRDYTGHLPDPSDSLDVLLLPHTLRIARATLRDTYGTDAIDWQWRHLQGGFTHPLTGEYLPPPPFRRSMPGASGAGGHPTSLFPGPSSRPPDRRPGTGAGPATWSAWAALGQPALRVRSPFRGETSPRVPTFTLGAAPPDERDRLTLVAPR